MIFSFSIGFILIYIVSLLAFLSLSHKNGQRTLGILTIISLSLLNGQILVLVPKVIKSKDVSCLYAPVAIGLFFTGVFWVAYGIAIKDIVLFLFDLTTQYIILANSTSLSSGIIQLLLLLLYRNSDSTRKSKMFNQGSTQTGRVHDDLENNQALDPASNA
jgi:uncharacterized protein with PQ loop repeat